MSGDMSSDSCIVLFLPYLPWTYANIPSTDFQAISTQISYKFFQDIGIFLPQALRDDYFMNQVVNYLSGLEWWI